MKRVDLYIQDLDTALSLELVIDSLFPMGGALIVIHLRKLKILYAYRAEE